MLTLSLSSCGRTDTLYENGKRNVTEEREKDSGSITKSADVLIAYFTVPEEMGNSDIDAIAQASVVIKGNEKMGNTEYIAKLIQKTIGGDLFRIETKDSYPTEHDMLLDQAAEEQESDYRPELSGHVDKLKQYDTIILGFPNWWGDLPMPVYSFLEECDFSNKTIIPFVTHDSSGLSDTLSTITQLQPGAEVSDNALIVSRGEVFKKDEEIKEWTEGLKLKD